MWLDLPQQQNYRTIGDATLEVFQHVVASYDFSFVLKVGAASELRFQAVALVLQEHLAQLSAATWQPPRCHRYCAIRYLLRQFRVMLSTPDGRRQLRERASAHRRAAEGVSECGLPPGGGVHGVSGAVNVK